MRVRGWGGGGVVWGVGGVCKLMAFLRLHTLMALWLAFCGPRNMPATMASPRVEGTVLRWRCNVLSHANGSSCDSEPNLVWPFPIAAPLRADHTVEPERARDGAVLVLIGFCSCGFPTLE